MFFTVMLNLYKARGPTDSKGLLWEEICADSGEITVNPSFEQVKIVVSISQRIGLWEVAVRVELISLQWYTEGMWWFATI